MPSSQRTASGRSSLGWLTLGKPFDETAAQHVIEAVGFLAAAVVALQIAQTIAEEEAKREDEKLE